MKVLGSIIMSVFFLFTKMVHCLFSYPYLLRTISFKSIIILLSSYKEWKSLSADEQKQEYLDVFFFLSVCIDDIFFMREKNRVEYCISGWSSTYVST